MSENGFGGVEIDILCAGAHASIKKAASITGIGRSRVIELIKKETNDEGRDLVAFDLVELEGRLKDAHEQGRGVIVCPAYGEVNTVSHSPLMMYTIEGLLLILNALHLWCFGDDY